METFIKSLAALHASGVPANNFANVHSIKSDYANWVIPGRLMCGPTPGATTYFPIVDPKEYQTNMDKILGDGIDTFICLQEEIDPNVSYKPMIKQIGVQIYHYPMKDDTTPPRNIFLTHLAHIIDLIRQGRRIYIHCAGGHGRASLYVACILACLYKEMRNFESVMYYVQTVHDLRRKQNKQFYGILPSMVCSAASQRQLVKDFLTVLSFL